MSDIKSKYLENGYDFNKPSREMIVASGKS